MLQTIVERAPANKQGEDIVDPLLATLESQVSRGRSEINRSCSNRRLVDCNIVPQGFISPTSVIQVTDMEIGAVFGIVDSFSLHISIDKDDVTVDSSITYEMED